MRAKEFLRGHGVLEAQYIDVNPLSTNRGIVTRDHFDVARSDLTLMNLIGAERVSIGSMFEAAWCFELRKPLIVAMEPGNIHAHGFLFEAAGYVVPTLEEALDLVIFILGSRPSAGR